MSAFKIRHKKTGKYLSHNAASRLIVIFLRGDVERAITEHGRTFSTRRGAETFFKRLGHWRDQFEIAEMITEQVKIPIELRMQLMKLMEEHVELRNSEGIKNIELYHKFLDWEKEVWKIISN